MTAHRIDVHATHGFAVTVEAADTDAAIRALERDLTARVMDPADPLQHFVICSARAMADAAAGDGVRTAPARMVRRA